MAYIKFEDTPEEKEIKYAVRRAQTYKQDYCFVSIDGREAILKPHAIGFEWLRRASIEDFRRIAIY